MPIEIRIEAATSGAGRGGAAGGAPVPTRASQTFQLTQQRHTFAIPSDAEPTNVELDPNAWVFGRLTLVKK
jgi:hypothetical protein